MEIAGAPAGAKLLYYPLQIRQRKVRALLDSGASVNCIDADLVYAVGGCVSKKLPGMLLYPDRRKALVIGTTELEVHGPGYRERVTFWVVQGLGVPILLGAPWLRAWNPKINWQSRELTFSDGVRWKAEQEGIIKTNSKNDIRIGKREQFRAMGFLALLPQSEGEQKEGITLQPEDKIELP